MGVLYVSFINFLYLYSMTGLYVKQCKFDMAEFFYADCLKKRTAVLGAKHPSTLHTLCNLSACYTHLVRTLLVSYI